MLGIEIKEEDSAISYWRMLNAQITHFLHIPFPEHLEEEEWWFKAEQYKLLNDKDFLPAKIEFK